MDTLEKLEYICNGYKKKEFDLTEFQSRLDSLMISDELKSELEKIKIAAINRIEEIKFCSLESNFYKYGVEVADSLIEVVKRLAH